LLFGFPFDFASQINGDRGRYFKYYFLLFLMAILVGSELGPTSIREGIQELKFEEFGDKDNILIIDIGNVSLVEEE
jgi:hypothetical protein